jgi:hypothetical protein
MHVHRTQLAGPPAAVRHASCRVEASTDWDHLLASDQYLVAADGLVPITVARAPENQQAMRFSLIDGTSARERDTPSVRGTQ